MFRRNRRVALLAACLVGGLSLSSAGFASAAAKRPTHRSRLALRPVASDQITVAERVTVPTEPTRPLVTTKPTEPPKAPEVPKPTEAPKPTEPPNVAEPESHNPLSLTLACGLAAGATQCSWSGDVSGVANYLLLRSTNSATGRAFGPFDPAIHSATDALNTRGAAYSYVVVARDASGKVIAHSDASKVNVPSAVA